MQNPFLRLKHYAPPSENHATEVLAACLVLSDNLRRGFIKFLFSEGVPFDAEELDSFTISTQAPIAGYGTVDLLIEIPEKYTVVVEVKVSAPEYGEQIRKYRRWLEETRTGKKHFIFSLVQTPKQAFKIREFRGDGRRTWHELYTFLSGEFKKTLTETTEINLVEKLCNYLEVEKIVINWDPKEIQAYGKGVLARKALQILFEQVAEELRNKSSQYDIKIEIDGDPWPYLQIGHREWSSIFGRKGSLQKLYAFYEPKGVDGGEDRFSFEICLWDKAQGADWKLTKQMISPWINQLKKNSFNFWVILKGSRALETDPSKYDFTESPKWISAYTLKKDTAYIEEYLTKSATELADSLFDRIVKYCEIISGLPRA